MLESSLPISLYPQKLGNLCGQSQSYSVESTHITISSNTGESMWSESIIFGWVCPHHFILRHMLYACRNFWFILLCLHHFCEANYIYVRQYTPINIMLTLPHYIFILNTPNHNLEETWLYYIWLCCQHLCGKYFGVSTSQTFIVALINIKYLSDC